MRSRRLIAELRSEHVALLDAFNQRTRQRDEWRALAECRKDVMAAQDREIDALRTALADVGRRLHQAPAKATPWRATPTIDVTTPGPAEQLLMTPGVWRDKPHEWWRS